MTTPAESAWRAMRTLVLELNDRRSLVAAELGLSFIRIKALRKLADAPMSMRDLGAALAIDAPYTTVVVDDLEQRGLVERRPDADDRRRKYVAATREGIRIAQAAGRLLDVPPPSLAGLPENDLHELARILHRALANATTEVHA